MESAARETNLSDVADRLGKIIGDAMDISRRIEDATDTLRGPRPSDEGKGANAPEPSGLVPLLTSRLSVLEHLQAEQRHGLNRLAEGLREAPPPTVLGAENQAKRAYR